MHKRNGGLIINIDTDVLNGTLTINGDNTITYVPDADFNGTDQFVYEVCDADGDCSTATVDLTINSIDDIVVANDDSKNSPSDTEATINVLFNDTGLGDEGIILTICQRKRALFLLVFAVALFRRLTLCRVSAFLSKEGLFYF